MDQNDRQEGVMSSSCQLACVVLAQGRNPEEMLRRLGVRAEHAERLTDNARRVGSDIIVYSLNPGSARVLVEYEYETSTRRYTRWHAKLVLLDHTYPSAGEALAAGERAYKRLKRRSAKVCGWGRHDLSFIHAIEKGVRYLCNREVAAPVEQPASPIRPSGTKPSDAVRSRFGDDGELVNVH